MLLRLYGDSLALPRASEGIPFKRTFAELIRAELERRLAEPVHLYNRSVGGAEIRDLFNRYSEDCAYFGDDARGILIVQCGIVDCAPRPIPPRMRAVIGRLPSTCQKPIIHVIHHNRARLQSAGFRWQRTPIELFGRLYAGWLSSALERFDTVVAVNIAPTTANIEQHSRGLGAAITEYNEAIRSAVCSVGSERVILADVHAAIVEAPHPIEHYVIARDGHHISAAGHDLYAAVLVRSIADHRAGFERHFIASKDV